MRKIIVFIFAIALSLETRGDQLMYLSLEQAKAATEFLQKQKQAILWCGCCENDPKVMVTISRVDYFHVEGAFYFVILRGETASGKYIEERLDLAYVHVNVGGKAKNLGRELKINCDPCTEPFKWGV
jgi:hypothetical protein